MPSVLVIVPILIVLLSRRDTQDGYCPTTSHAPRPLVGPAQGRARLDIASSIPKRRAFAGPTRWKVPAGAPERSVAEATLAGGEDKTVLCSGADEVVPGHMTAPHVYRPPMCSRRRSLVAQQRPGLRPGPGHPDLSGHDRQTIGRYVSPRRHARRDDRISGARNLRYRTFEQSLVDASLPPLTRI